MARQRVEITVVVPCYNEEALVERTLRRVSEYLRSRGAEYEIIAVDDGSSDATAEIIGTLSKEDPNIRLLKNPGNRGKGYSVRAGSVQARGEFVCFSDADLSTPIEEIEKLIGEIKKGFDIAIGSRSIAGSDVAIRQKAWRELMGKTFNLFVRLSSVPDIKDTQCGFKCFTKKAAMEVYPRMKIDGFGFDVEALYLARKLGFKIKEVPVRWLNRFESRVNPLIHPLQMLRDIIAMRIRDALGRYGRP